jgi:hypothetical protein
LREAGKRGSEAVFEGVLRRDCNCLGPACWDAESIASAAAAYAGAEAKQWVGVARGIYRRLPVDLVFQSDHDRIVSELKECDRLYSSQAGENIEDRLFEFIKANRSAFQF